MRGPDYDTAEMLKRLQRQVADLRSGGGEESVTITQNLSDDVTGSDTIGFPSHAIAFGGIGTSGRVELGADYGSPQEFSVSFLVRPENVGGDGGGTDQTLVVGTNDNPTEFVALAAGGAISFGVPGVDTSSFTGGSLVDGDVYHVVVTYDQADRRIIVDGETVATENIGSGTVALSSLFVGSDGSTGNTFEGVVDSLVFHERALSEVDARALASHVGVPAGRVGRWLFDRGPGAQPVDDERNVDGTRYDPAAYTAPLEWEYDPGFVWSNDPWGIDEW